MKIYLSGPMKGYPEKNFPLFNAVAEMLRQSGHWVYNPAEYNKEPFVLREAFAAYSRFICEEADAIVLLPGWEKSVGVGAERALADNCGLEIIEFKDLILKIKGDLVHKHEQIAKGPQMGSDPTTPVETVTDTFKGYPVREYPDA